MSRMRIPLLLWLLLLTGLVFRPAYGQSLHVMDAASFDESAAISPNMIIAVFGANLTNTTAMAASGAALPTKLGGATLTINGTEALLIYASPGQINAIVGPTTSLGTGTAVVTSPTGMFTTAVTVSAASSAGIFSLESTGTHDGAIVNAMTSGTIAFSPTTNGAPTYLALFVTGLDVTQPPSVMIGGVSATVQWFGPAPGFTGLEQINVQLPSSLAGAGRVEVVIAQGANTSNVVEIVLLPDKDNDAFSDAVENREHSRELSAIAAIPGTSLILAADENDDVVRVVDIAARKVARVIDLPDGAEPVALAVTSDGKTAVVAERSRAMVAVIDLSTGLVKFEAATGNGPRAVAIAGNQAVVVNQDSDSVSFIDISTGAKIAPDVSAGGRAPRGVAIDGTNRAWVTIQDAGAVLPIDLATHTALTAMSLGVGARPAAIQIIAPLGLLAITEPGTSATGKVFIVNPSTQTSVAVNVNPGRSGGASDLLVYGNNVFFADQTGGTVTMVPVSVLSTGQIVAPPTAITVGAGVRSIAIDAADKLLVATNEGAGRLVLIDLTSFAIVGKINAVVTGGEGDDGDDNHSDRGDAPNAPVISSLSPSSAAAGATFTLTITGKNLQNASAILFLGVSQVPGKGKGSGHMDHLTIATDPMIAVSGIASTSTSVTATVTVAPGHAPGPQLVEVVTPNGTSESLSAVFAVR